jgi:hypothetical protein
MTPASPSSVRLLRKSVQHSTSTSAPAVGATSSKATACERGSSTLRRRKRCVLLYCGDHDPGGLHLSDHLRSNFGDLSGAVGWGPENLIIERFGREP